MRKTTFLRLPGGALFLVFGLVGPWMPSLCAQTNQVAPTSYSDIWTPVTAAQTRQLVRQNANNGLALQKLWWRANLYSQAWSYLSELQSIIQQQPANATAPAAYALGLVNWRRAQYTGQLSQEVATKVDLSEPHILSLLDTSKKLNRRSWLAYVADSQFSPRQSGSWPPSKDEVAAARKAYAIQANPLTILTLAQALQSQAIDVQKKEDGLRGVALLQHASTRFPNYPAIDAALYQYYTYYPYTKDLVAGQKAKQRLISSIKPSLRQTEPIQRYLKSLELK